MTHFEDLREDWERLGRADPLWAVLTHPGKSRNRWDPTEFFATGQADLERIRGIIGGRGIEFPRGHGLDFGCGVGRLTQALARQASSMVGVDIAASMLEQARRYDESAGRCRFLLNASADLRQFPEGAFDFSFSFLVLQHIPPPAAEGYVREMVRVVRPGGLVVFELPSRRGWTRIVRTLAPRLVDRIRAARSRAARLAGKPMIEMNPVPASEVTRWLGSANAPLLFREVLGVVRTVRVRDIRGEED